MVFQARAALPNFPQPEDGRLRVWRYLDLERLISLLAKREMVYVRSDLLGDPFEGSLPLALHEWSKSVPAPPNQTASEIRTAFRKQIFLSCWHLNEHESEAMWRLYCGAEKGVAIQTTYEKLAAAVPFDGFIAKVRYEDYGSYVPDRDEQMNMLWPFLIKRPSFSHEQEVRIVVPRIAPFTANEQGRTLQELLGKIQPRVVVDRFDASETIEKVWVSPYAQPWYREVVGTVLDKFAPDLASRLDWSEMRADPLF